MKWFSIPCVMVFALVCVGNVQTSFAGSDADVYNYITQYKDIAVSEMFRVKIPASITLAQGIHESGAAQSRWQRKPIITLALNAAVIG